MANKLTKGATTASIAADFRGMVARKAPTAPYNPAVASSNGVQNSDTGAANATWSANYARDKVAPTTPMGSGVPGQS